MRTTHCAAPATFRSVAVRSAAPLIRPVWQMEPAAPTTAKPAAMEHFVATTANSASGVPVVPRNGSIPPAMEKRAVQRVKFRRGVRVVRRSRHARMGSLVVRTVTIAIRTTRAARIATIARMETSAVWAPIACVARQRPFAFPRRIAATTSSARGRAITAVAAVQPVAGYRNNVATAFAVTLVTTIRAAQDIPPVTTGTTLFAVRMMDPAAPGIYWTNAARPAGCVAGKAQWSARIAVVLKGHSAMSITRTRSNTSRVALKINRPAWAGVVPSGKIATLRE